MTVRSRALLSFASVAVAGTLAACGGSSSVTGTETTASSPAVAAPASTATIAGTLLSSDGAARTGDVGTLSKAGGIRVTVSGTSLEATTDDDGRFTLGGVTPGGRVVLRFEGSGIDARLEIEGLVAGQTLTITVSVSGATASMVHPDDDSEDVEFKGYVESVGTTSLMVAGRMVTVDDMTEILGNDGHAIVLSDVPVGAYVEVEGRMQADGSVLAKKIELEDGDNEVEFKGYVESVGTTSLMVAGRMVTVDDMTEILSHDGHPIMLSEIPVEAYVEVEGRMQADGSVLAWKIELEDDGHDDGHDDGDDDGDDDDYDYTEEVEFLGYVKSVGMNSLMVGDRMVTVNSMTEILYYDGSPIPLSYVLVGSRMEVEGWMQADGSVVGKKIQLEDDDTEVEFKGYVQSVGSNSLMVDGRMVTVNDKTEILGYDGDPIETGSRFDKLGLGVAHAAGASSD